MNILGPEEVIFGVDDVPGTRAFLADYGLREVDWSDAGGRYEALDGSAVVVRRKDDPTLPAPLPTTNMLRQTVYGVADQATIDAIAAELSKDRTVDRFADGSIAAHDDMGFYLGFRLTRRIALDLDPVDVNTPGSPPRRAVNAVGAAHEMDCRPRTLSHVVYFVPDIPKMEGFYANRLGFEVTDRFTNLGPFMKPKGSSDHHTLFMIKTPPHLLGMEHIAFHMRGATEVLLAGSKLIGKGYQSFWGPGRHHFASNWFWYFNSPLGCHVEYDADMDTIDDNWTPREVEASPHEAQIFLFEHQEKWSPIGPRKPEPAH